MPGLFKARNKWAGTSTGRWTASPLTRLGKVVAMCVLPAYPRMYMVGQRRAWSGPRGPGQERSLSDALLPLRARQGRFFSVWPPEVFAGGSFVGVPAKLGRNGVEKIVELDLNDSELTEFKKSLEHVKQLTANVDKLL